VYHRLLGKAIKSRAYLLSIFVLFAQLPFRVTHIQKSAAQMDASFALLKHTIFYVSYLMLTFEKTSSSSPRLRMK
jgi:hypothetical protein